MAQAELPAVEVAVVEPESRRHSLDQHLQAEVWASSSRRKWILEQMGDAHPDNIGVDTGYRGENAGYFHFVTEVPRMLFRAHGSVLPFVAIETTIATFIGVLCTLAVKNDFFTYEAPGMAGHSTVGVFLSFLLVFRSQIAWNLYMGGIGALASMRTTITNLASISLAAIVHHCAVTGKPLPQEAHEMVRLLKLFFFIAIEHLRSIHGAGPWMWAQEIAYSFALPHEIAEFEEEYGRFQSVAAKRSVRRSGKSAVEFDAKWSAARPEPCASPMAMYMYP
jgi:hypothetical protein